jgi:hypothetical protein
MMKTKATRITGIRFSEATYKAVVQAAKARDFASPSAFMRAAVEKELRGADATLGESEQASARLWKSIRSRSGGLVPGSRPCSLMWMHWPK